MPIGEAGESFPQLVDSSVEFSTCVDLFHPHVWKTSVLPVLRKAAVRLRFGEPFRLVGSFASTDRRFSAKAKRPSWALRARHRVRYGRTRVGFREEASKGLLRNRICVGDAGENRFSRPSGGPKRPVWCGKEEDKSAGRRVCVHSFSTGKERRSTGRMTRVSLVTRTQALVV